MNSVINEKLVFADGDEEHLVRLTDDPHSHFSGGIVQQPGHTSFEFMNLYVSQERRRQGVATTLAKALVSTAISLGAQSFEGSVNSPQTLKIFDKLFGNNIDYYDNDDSLNRDRIYLPMSNKQAISSLERATEFEEYPEHRDNNFEVVVDLSIIDPRLVAPSHN